MAHEDKSEVPFSSSGNVDRPRVVSAAVVDQGEGDATSENGTRRPPGVLALEVQRPEKGPNSHPNNVRRLRIERMMSKAELARRANVSVLTIDRVEKGYGCRMDTKRKVLEALGLGLKDRVQVFGDDD